MQLLEKDQFDALPLEDQQDYIKLLKKYNDFKKYNALSFFTPYEFQKKFYDLGKTEKVRALIAANRCGKTYCAAMETAYHLTGKYPKWWEGRRFDKPIRGVAASVSSQQVRKAIQKELLGTENRDIEEDIGTAALPRSDIDINKSNKTRDGAFSELVVKHVSGGSSTITLFSYTQGAAPMQGFSADWIWVDEQAPHHFDDIFSELVKRTMTTKGSVIATFTPLQGLTHIVREFWEPNGQFHSGLVNAGWLDVDHLDEEEMQATLKATPPHLRDAVTRGIPVLGSGAVFNIGEADIYYDDIEIGDTWPRICGCDVGFTSDPTAAIFLAQDPSTKIYYIYDEYGSIDNNIQPPSYHVSKLHAKGCAHIPIIYDSAAKAKVGAHGKAVTELWEEMGLKVLPKPFRNPKWLCNQSRDFNSISLGLTHMFELMSTGRLKVHRRCVNWWREFRAYSYDDKGVPSADANHWIDASRYAVMSAEAGLMEKPGRYDFHDQWDESFHFSVI